MNLRYRSILFFFVILFLLITLRLIYWQVVRAQELTSLGEAQYGWQIKLTPKRGEILTSDGFPIAANRLTYLVFANPKEMKKKEQAATLLSSALNLDKASISAELSLERYWVPLATQVESAKKDKVASLNLTGIGFEQQTVRMYPEASMAAQLLGFVGKDNAGDNKGYFGLEGYYDRQLRGKPGIAVQVHDALGRPILAKMNDTTNEVDGRTLKTHIDRVVQYIMERELKRGIKLYGAEAGWAVAMNPKTGAVLAMSSFPAFDPAQYQNYDDSLYKNPIITDTYEPGSTFKPLIMASAIDAGLVKPDTKCTTCAGPISSSGYEIHTWNDKYHPNETMTETLQYSDNVGMVFVAHKLGLSRMLSYLGKFGIGNVTGIDLQGEVAPGIRPRSEWYPIDRDTASFGQGITVTPIELLDAFSAIANGGTRMEPHVVSSIDSPGGGTITIPPKVLDRPISPQSATIMNEMLVNTAVNGETKWLKMGQFDIAGKTGTAQIPVAGHYDPTNTIASFIGFAPASDPKFAMLVVMVKPTNAIYGAETAAPVFLNITKDVLTYYGITAQDVTK